MVQLLYVTVFYPDAFTLLSTLNIVYSHKNYAQFSLLDKHKELCFSFSHA